MRLYGYGAMGLWGYAAVRLCGLRGCGVAGLRANHFITLTLSSPQDLPMTNELKV